jgi:hypothetical protein
MMIKQHTLHTSRPIEIKDTADTMAANYAKALGVNKVEVKIDEHPEMRPCANPTVPDHDKPHCHYAITITYDPDDLAPLPEPPKPVKKSRKPRAKKPLTKRKKPGTLAA